MVKCIKGLWLIVLLIDITACSSNFIALENQNKGLDANSLLRKSPDTFEKIGTLPSQELGPLSIHFISEQKGWLVAGKKLWRTSDSGKSWTLIYSLPSELNFIDKIEFINDQVGWLGWGGHIYKTEDEGSTWTPLLLEQKIETFELLPDGKRGWLAREMYRPTSKEERDVIASEYLSADGKSVKYIAIFYTEDGGKSWKQQPIQSEVKDISTFYCLDAEHGWAFSDHGVFYLREGQWKEVGPSTSKCSHQEFLESLSQGKGMPRFGPIEIFFVNPNTGWLSFSSGNKAWTLAKSTDGGVTWCDLPHLGYSEATFPPFFRKLYFDNQTDGLGLDNYGMLYATKDGGITWTKLESDTQFLDMYFIDANHGWIISKDAMFRLRL